MAKTKKSDSEKAEDAHVSNCSRQMRELARRCKDLDRRWKLLRQGQSKNGDTENSLDAENSRNFARMAFSGWLMLSWDAVDDETIRQLEATCQIFKDLDRRRRLVRKGTPQKNDTEESLQVEYSRAGDRLIRELDEAKARRDEHKTAKRKRKAVTA